MSAAVHNALPILSRTDLEVLGLVQTPLAVFGFDANRICWVNAAARDLPPGIVPSTLSHEVKNEHVKTRVLRGETVEQVWTNFESSKPVTLKASLKGVKVEEIGPGMLVEFQILTASESLPDSERRALEMFATAPAMLSMFSERGELLWRNAAALSCFGAFDAALAPGSDVLRAQFVNPKDCDSLIKIMNEHGSSAGSAAMALPGAPVHGLDMRRFGDPVTGEAAILVTQADVSTLAHLMGFRAADARDEMDNLIALTAVPLIVLSPTDASIRRSNPAAQTRFGARVQSGCPVRHVFADPSQANSLVNAIRASGSGQVACYLRGSDEGLIWSAVTGARASGPTGESIVLMVSDIDSLHRRSVVLEEALDFERRINELQRRYLAFAAHDFRTPLAIIDSAAQKILRKGPVEPLDPVSQSASKIRATVRRMLDLVEATIGKARAGTGLWGLDLADGDLAALVRRVVDLQQDLHRDISIDLQMGDLGYVSFDTLLIEQALSNILSNSIKYSGSAKKVMVTAKRNADNVILRFRDWGIGVPPEQLESIFAAYSRGENVGSIPGSGLGLSIAKQIIEMHEGSLRLAESSSSGSTFEIVIPVHMQAR